MAVFGIQHNQGDFQKVTMLTYGVPKSGKTTLNHAFGTLFGKPPLMIMTEDGLGGLKASTARITSWADFQKLMVKMNISRKEILTDYSCAVVDLIGELDQLCTAYICKTNGVETLADMAHGKGWYIQDIEFKKQVSTLLSFGLPVKFIAHAKERMVKEGKVEKYSYEPDIGKKAKAYILGKCDCIGFIEPVRNDGSNVISFKSNVALDTGTRFPKIAKAYTMNHADLSKTLIEIEKDFKS